MPRQDPRRRRCAGAALALGILVLFAVGGGPQPVGAGNLSELLDPANLVRLLLEAHLGRRVDFESVTWQASPPRIQVGVLRVAGDTPTAPPLVEAFGASLPVDTSALVDGALVIDPLHAERATWNLRPGLALALRDLDARLEARQREEPLSFRGGATLETGGALRTEGAGRPGGPLRILLQLDDVNLAPVADALPKVARLSGLANGEIHFAGPTDAPETFRAEIAVRDTHVLLRDIELRRALSLRADLAELVGAHASGRARFDIDASLAEIVYAGGAYQKPVGKPASVVGTLARAENGEWRLEEARVHVGSDAATPSTARPGKATGGSAAASPDR